MAKEFDVDLKWLVILALVTGGTNVAQYFGITQPEAETASEAQATTELIRDELHACLDELKKCYANCGASTSNWEEAGDWYDDVYPGVTLE